MSVALPSERRGRRFPGVGLETDRGRIVVRLEAGEVPLTVQTVVRLARSGRYEGTPFHRAVSNFVAQGGDVSGSGKDTESSQFFLVHSMQPPLDGHYAAFGWVAEGMDVLDSIRRGDRLVHATVEPNR